LLDGLIQAAHTTIDALVAQVKRQVTKLGEYRGAANGWTVSDLQSASACDQHRGRKA